MRAGAGRIVMLILRRLGRGNWSPVELRYDAARQGQMPTPVQARVGARIELAGVVYRVSRVLA
jgi:hypothetical protein